MDSELETETIIEGNGEEIEERMQKLNGEDVVKRYAKGKLLGKGGFAKCYELKCLSNKKIYAGKIISKSNITKQSAKNKLKSEIKIHRSMSHQNIVKFEHYFEDSENVYILLELCKSKTLNELIKKRKIISELEVKYYLFQILSAVKYMHANKVIHRDLKLGNLFLSSTLQIKIGDFGLATRIEYEGERKHTVCGTPNYIAPEILEGKNNGHSYQVDYWAIGVIIYTLLIGRPPFETDDVKETYKKITDINYNFPNNVFISENAKDFIKNILKKNPNDRLTPDQMLQHDFMKVTKLPKEMPHYTLSNPPKIDFFRKYQSDEQENKIINPNQLSFENDKENLKIMKNFALQTLKKCDINIGYVDLKETIKNYDDNKKKLNLSSNKENHKLLKTINIENLNINNLPYVDVLYDYSEKFGILYKLKYLIGCVFNDKSILFKILDKNYVYYVNKKKGINKPKLFENKNIITELKQKYEVLCNFEKYIKLENEKNKTTVKIENELIYVKKIIKSDLAILLKLSNKMIQLTFKDNTKIIIDNDNTKKVYFFDKNNKKSVYSIHLVNKSNNKRFLNRYEHYKKIFFEKMDERFQRIQQQKELEKENLTEGSEISPLDLNKTL